MKEMQSSERSKSQRINTAQLNHRKMKLSIHTRVLSESEYVRPRMSEFAEL